MLRHEPAAADAEFGIAFGGEHAFDQFHARPDAAGILPAAARTAEPFAEDGARQHQPAFVLLRANRAANWPGRSPSCKAQSCEASRFVETARREPLGMPLTALTSSSPLPGPDHPRQQVGEALARAFDAGRNDAAGDDRRLEQAEVVFGEIEHVGQVRDVRGGAKIHAGQAQQRFIDHAQVGFDGRPRDGSRARARRGQSRRSKPWPLRDNPCRERKYRSSRNA